MNMLTQMSHLISLCVHGLDNDVGDLISRHDDLDVCRPPQLLLALVDVVVLLGGVPAEDHGIDVVEEGRDDGGEEELVQSLIVRFGMHVNA